MSELVFFYCLILILIISIIYLIWFNRRKKRKANLILTAISLTVISLYIFQMKPIWLNPNLGPDHKFTPINNIAELKNFITDSNKQPIILDFYADWCVACLEYEKFTFSNPNIINLLDRFELLQVDVTKNNREHQLLLQKFDLFGPPGIIFFDSEGVEIKELRTIGFKNATDFSSILLRVQN